MIGGATLAAKSAPTKIRSALPILVAVGFSVYTVPSVSAVGGGGCVGGGSKLGV